MKTLQAFVALLSVILFEFSTANRQHQTIRRQSNVTKHIFNATVDHFSYSVPSRHFSLRYFVDDTQWNPSGGPVFFYAGNEAPIPQFIENSGFMFEIAPEFEAMVVFCEHRYYGESIPDQNDLSYLTVEQALLDFNTLVGHMRVQWSMPPSSAFVVFGGSYGGNLALWLRLRNPNLWAGAIASSATPLKHLLRETNAFARIETEAYGNVSAKCPELVKEGWDTLYHLAKTQEGQTEIIQTLALCSVDGKAIAVNADWVHDWVGSALETLVQYGYPYPTNFYNPVPGYPFAVACRRMVEARNGLGALRAAVDVFHNSSGQAGSCYDYDTLVKRAATSLHRKGDHGRLHQYEHGFSVLGKSLVTRQLKSSMTSTSGVSLNEAWGYQTCTQAYQPMPTYGTTDFEIPYTPNKTAYFARCRKRYGVHPRPNWEEMTFQGARIGAGSNIFLTTGQLDPWRAAGIQWQPKGSTENQIIVRQIEKGAHHFDLRATHPMDPASVTRVRREERMAIRKWVGEWQQAECLLDEGRPSLSG